MAYRPDEMAILKVVSAKVDDDTLMLLALMYHTEPQTGDNIVLNPNGKPPIDRSKSWYKFIGRTAKISDLNAEIAYAKDHPTETWSWPSFPGYVIAGKEPSRLSDAARWLSLKIKKAVDWPTAEKIFKGWKRSTDDYKDSRKYDTTGYTTDDGKSLDITLDNIKALGPGHTFTKTICTKKA